MNENKIVEQLAEDFALQVSGGKRNNEFAAVKIGYLQSQAELSRLQAENAALKEAQRWVPVEERLPEFLQAVLIWTNISLSPDRAVFYKKGKWLFQSTNENFFTDKQPHIIITHWMPLPTPPTTPNTGNAR